MVYSLYVINIRCGCGLGLVCIYIYCIYIYLSFYGANGKVDIVLRKTRRKLKFATTWDRTRVSRIPGKRLNH